MNEFLEIKDQATKDAILNHKSANIKVEQTGFTIKSSHTIHVLSDDTLDAAPKISKEDLAKLFTGPNLSNYKIPLMVGKLEGTVCNVFANSKTIKMAYDDLYQLFFVEILMACVENRFDIQIDRDFRVEKLSIENFSHQSTPIYIVDGKTITWECQIEDNASVLIDCVNIYIDGKPWRCPFSIKKETVECEKTKNKIKIKFKIE